MNKLFDDMQYIFIINKLGDHLESAYGLTKSQIQGIKHKIQLAVEEMVGDEELRCVEG